MNFLWVIIEFYDTVCIFHDVIITFNPYLYAANFMFAGVRVKTEENN